MQSAKRNSRKLSTQWSPALHLKNLADIPARLNQPFEDTFEGTSGGKPVTISNCSDYLRFSKQGLKAAKEREYSVLHLNGVDCVAIDLLQTAKPAHSSFLSNFQIKRESLDVLPPELAPAVSRDTAAEVHAADIAGKSWKTYAKDVRVTNGAGPSQIVVTERNWTTRVTEYGRADFTGDGVEDLLVRTDTAATQGTYGNAQLFILSRKSNGGRLTFERAVPVP